MYKNNYWPTEKDRKILRLSQNYGLMVYPEKNKKGLTLVVTFKHERVIVSGDLTDKNIGHATFVTYDKFYRKLYKHKTILVDDSVDQVVDKPVEKHVNKNPLHGKQNKIF